MTGKKLTSSMIKTAFKYTSTDKNTPKYLQVEWLRVTAERYCVQSVIVIV